ncbi:MAG: DUF5686 and carboxypeptidase regulatory-like domain-containing protein [Duncaniella sp.]|nr:DUF5686 and carboxypeptidase regulatory-like domain-containing protein [Duncaniella sp.]
MLAVCTGAVPVQNPGAAVYTDLNGKVTDAATGEAVPFATVFLKGSERGVLTEDDGRYRIQTAHRFDSIMVSAMGYETIAVPAGKRRKGGRMTVNVSLTPTGVMLGEVTVKPRREKYSKKDNPAVQMMEKIRARQDSGNPALRHPYYSFDKYEIITLGVKDYKHYLPMDTSGRSAKMFNFLTQYIDTSSITGEPVLNLSVREKSSQVYNRRDPRSVKEYVLGLRNAGLDEIMDPKSMQKMFEDVLREIDLYQNDIPLFQVRFVSPLSRIAPDFYKFYLTDTVVMDSVPCYELTFVPHNSSQMGFTGRMYVAAGDSTMFLRRITLRVPHNINLNFVSDLAVTQTFDRAEDGSRLKTSDELAFEASWLPGLPGVTGTRRVRYTGHRFEPAPDSSIYERGLRQVIDPAVYSRGEDFWADARKMPLQYGEANIGRMMADLRGKPLYYYGEKTVRLLGIGYVATGNPSRFDIGKLLTFVTYNDVEGLRLRFGGMTTANLSKRLFGRGYAAYGFKDHRWKYQVEAEYSFNDKEYHAREFPVHSLTLTSAYDMKRMGESFESTNSDNIFDAIKSQRDVMMLYERLNSLTYKMENEHNFSVSATLRHVRREPCRYLTFTDGFGRQVSHYNNVSATAEIRWAPGEKFYQGRNSRRPINFDAPVFTLSHTWGPRGVLGNNWAIAKTELSFSKKFWLSAFGDIDLYIKGSHVWTQVSYPDLLKPSVNSSYMIRARSFTLLRSMEFINDSQLELHATYWTKGLIFNQIPYVRKLKMREVFFVRALWGHLSRKNRPQDNPSLFRFPEGAPAYRMGATPYVEAGVGLDNILRVLRVDYTHRFTYLHHPGALKNAVRFRVHFSF